MADRHWRAGLALSSGGSPAAQARALPLRRPGVAEQFFRAIVARLHAPSDVDVFQVACASRFIGN